MTIKPKALLSLIIGAFIMVSCSGCLPTIRHNTDSTSRSHQTIVQERAPSTLSFFATEQRLKTLKEWYDQKLIPEKAYEQGVILTLEKY